MDIECLLELQREDGLYRDLQHELKVLLPKRRAEAKARLQAARAAVEVATQENLAALREYERFQRDYTRRREQMSRAERNAMGMTSARGLEAAMAEHDAARLAGDRAAASAHDAAHNLTPTERKLDQARAFEAEEDAAVQAIYDAIDERKAQVVAEAEKVKMRCEEAAAKVPASLLDYYQRLKQTRWPCVVEYDRKQSVCTGCHLIQPPAVTQAVLSAKNHPEANDFVRCPSCGRILM